MRTVKKCVVLAKEWVAQNPELARFNRVDALDSKLALDSIGAICALIALVTIEVACLPLQNVPLRLQRIGRTLHVRTDAHTTQFIHCCRRRSGCRMVLSHVDYEAQCGNFSFEVAIHCSVSCDRVPGGFVDGIN